MLGRLCHVCSDTRKLKGMYPTAQAKAARAMCIVLSNARGKKTWLKRVTYACMCPVLRHLDTQTEMVVEASGAWLPATQMQAKQCFKQCLRTCGVPACQQRRLSFVKKSDFKSGLPYCKIACQAELPHRQGNLRGKLLDMD